MRVDLDVSQNHRLTGSMNYRHINSTPDTTNNAQVPFPGFPGLGFLVNPMSSWSWSRMLFWVLVLAAAWYDRRVFKFPFIRLISAVVFCH